MTALERLSKIKNVQTFYDWYVNGIENQVADIIEIVAIAKTNQQPSINDIQFEIDKMENLLAATKKITDAFFAQLQKDQLRQLKNY